MRRALLLAERGWGMVHPNPMVGAVLVKDGVVVAEGWHEEYGGAHAETRAIANAGDSAAGSTLYVTLEPCAHHGKTPPCAAAVIAAGITRVVFAAHDPNGTAAGGHAVLADAGVDVTPGVLASEAQSLNAIFTHVHTQTTPYVALKLALSLDGRIAEGAGIETAITGAEAAAAVHRLRAGFDAILVGIGTVLADDPMLTARGSISPRVPPARVVADSSLQLPLSSNLVRTAADAPVIVVTAQNADDRRARALHDAGVTVLRVPETTRPGGRMDVHGILAALWEQDIHSVLCEGGGRLAGSLLVEDVVNRLTLFYGPLVLGPGGIPAFDVPPGHDGRPRTLAPHDWVGPVVSHYGRDFAVRFDRSADPGERSGTRPE